MKTETGLFVCVECGFTARNARGLSTHIQFKHGSKYYYDKWLKKPNDGACIICGNETKFIKLSDGYRDTCSNKCCVIHKNNLIKKICLEKYDVENISQLSEIKKQKEKSCIKHHGVKAGFADVKKRSKTNLKKYGAEHASQNENIHKKIEQSCLRFHKYLNSDIWYQSSYEYDFLEKYFSKYPDITRGITIKYEFEKKEKIYYPDFYIPSLNLIVECKNSYLAKRDSDKIHQKKLATLKLGFNYIMIINKNYTEFNQFH